MARSNRIGFRVVARRTHPLLAWLRSALANEGRARRYRFVSEQARRVTERGQRDMQAICRANETHHAEGSQRSRCRWLGGVTPRRAQYRFAGIDIFPVKAVKLNSVLPAPNRGARPQSATSNQSSPIKHSCLPFKTTDEPQVDRHRADPLLIVRLLLHGIEVVARRR